MTPEAVGAQTGSVAGDALMFDVAPVSLWLEDYSGIRRQFEEWRAAGVSDIRSFLLEDVGRVKACSDSIRILRVNRKTLQLYEAADLPELVANLWRVFSDEMFASHCDELVQLWNGATTFTSNAVNYSLSERRLDIQLSGTILPGCEDSWERVLVAIEDVTQREDARRLHAIAERYARGLFDHSPVSLWVEDFSSIKRLMDDVRNRGILDFRVFTDVHPEFVVRCLSEIRVLEVNRHTLELFAAPDTSTLVSRLDEVFRDGMVDHFREQLIDLWNGKLFQQREVINYTLDGTELYLHMQFSVLPGFEQDWSQVQVALTDITARKKAEAYLEYLGKHDVLTTLYNRSFYVEEMNRLDRKGPRPVTIMIIDINDLKAVNDQLGHAAGDALLRRLGEVLGEAVDKPHHAARIGGDEFAVLMPATDAAGGQAMVETIYKLLELNNQYYSAHVLTVSIGRATSEPGERLENVARRADLLMYDAKNEFHASSSRLRV